jgi:hypothetical protein
MQKLLPNSVHTANLMPAAGALARLQFWAPGRSTVAPSREPARHVEFIWSLWLRNP